MSFTHTVETIGKVVDAAGVVVIIAGIVVATGLAVARRTGGGDQTVRLFRRRIGTAILLGLEILVAADIIRTVAVSPTLQGAGVLAIIVAIRTFLSVSLEVELSGRWPWQRGADPGR